MALAQLPFFNSLSMPGVSVVPELVTVYTGGRAYPVHSSIIEAQFPGLQPMIFQGVLDLPMLADMLWSHHLRFWGIHHAQIRHVLKLLFGVFKGEKMFFQGFHHTVIQHLERIFEQDLYHVTWAPLRRSRKHFLVLATLARITQSNTLAHVLLEVYYRHWREILRTERADRDLYMWCVAIMELQDLISPAEVHNCLRSLASKRHKIINAYHSSGFRDPRIDLLMEMLMQMQVAGDDGFRGRGRRRPMLNYFPTGPRARTMPPLRMPMLIPPRADALALTPAFPSPSPSMDLAMSGGYMGAPIEAEMDNLHMRQNLLEQEVDHLRQEVGVW